MDGEKSRTGEQRNSGSLLPNWVMLKCHKEGHRHTEGRMGKVKHVELFQWFEVGRRCVSCFFSPVSDSRMLAVVDVCGCPPLAEIRMTSLCQTFWPRSVCFSRMAMKRVRGVLDAEMGCCRTGRCQCSLFICKVALGRRQLLSW